MKKKPSHSMQEQIVKKIAL